MKQSAGIILLDIREMAEARVLCLRAFNNWDFPKGRLDSGETHIQAAILSTLRHLLQRATWIQIFVPIFTTQCRSPRLAPTRSGRKRERSYRWIPSAT